MQVIHFGQIVIPALVENSNFEAKKYILISSIPNGSLTLSWRRSLSYRNQSIDLIGFYMVTASVMKGLTDID